MNNLYDSNIQSTGTFAIRISQNKFFLKTFWPLIYSVSHELVQIIEQNYDLFLYNVISVQIDKKPNNIFIFRIFYWNAGMFRNFDQISTKYSCEIKIEIEKAIKREIYVVGGVQSIYEA